MWVRSWSSRRFNAGIRQNLIRKLITSCFGGGNSALRKLGPRCLDRAGQGEVDLTARGISWREG